MSKKSKKEAPIDGEQSVSETFGAILHHNFDYLRAWETTARSWEDTEGVHQMRVSLRRMRSALRIFRSAVPAEVSRYWAQEMRDLANQLGPARDLDVFIDEGLTTVSGKLALPGEEELLALARQRREAAYADVLAMLDGDRYARFKEAFSGWLETPGWRQGELPGKYLKQLDSNIIAFARKRLDKLERQVLATGKHVDPACSEEMHQLRIYCKQLRYAAEFFLPLFSGMDGFIAHLKGLQDLLGVMNDVAVMQHLLEDLLANTDDCEPLQYAGGLVGWRTHEDHHLRGHFHERWEAFVDAKHPWWK